VLGAGGERVASGEGQRFCDRMRGQKRPDSRSCISAVQAGQVFNWIRSFRFIPPRGWAAGILGLTRPATGLVLFLHGLVASAATNDPATLTAFQHPSVPDSRSQTPKKASGLMGCSKFYDWLETHPRLS
jgi:hypothetical protein